MPKDIRLDTFTCDPKHTNSMTIYNQLDSRANDNSTDATDPFFALMKKWDGTRPGNHQAPWRKRLLLSDQHHGL